MTAAASPDLDEPPQSFDVFISHAGADRAVAVRLRTSLVDAGLQPWASFTDIPVGAPYPERIVQAIAACRAVVLLVSRASMRSEHVYREIVEASSGGKPMLPVYLEADVALPAGLRYYLGTLHRLKLTPETIEKAGPLVAAALRDRGAWSREAQPPTLADRYRASRLPSWPATFAAAALAGLVVWVAQAAWRDRQALREQAERDALPDALALLQILTAERTSSNQKWNLQLSVTPAAPNTAFSRLRLVLTSREDDNGPAQRYDLSPAFDAKQVGGGQMLTVQVPSLGRRLVACLSLPHPSSGEARRLTAHFGGSPRSADGVERIDFRSVHVPIATSEDGRPCE